MSTRPTLKTISQSTARKKIKRSVQQYLTLKRLYLEIEDLVQMLNLSPEAIRYYAGWVINAQTKAQIFEIEDIYKKYLYLITFVVFQYRNYQDTLLDIVLKCINQYNSTVEKTFNAKKLKASEEKDQLGDDVLKGYQSKTEMLNQARNVIYKQHADNNWKIEILKSIIPQEASEQERKSDQNANELGKKLSEKEIQRMLYEIMIEKSDTLHDKVADIIKHLNFAVTNPDLLQAIEYYQSNRKVTKNAPFNHLNAIEYKAVYKGEKFEAKLYKSFLFMHIYENVRNGTISLTHSYKYLPIENYMIDEEQWQKNRIHILKRLGLDKFANINDVLKVLQGKLDKVYYDINKRIVNRKNKFVRYGKDGQFVMNTPAVEKPDYQGLAQLFNHFENIPILNIIRDIDNHTSFSSNF